MNVPGFERLRDADGASFYRSTVPAFATPEATAAEILRRFRGVVQTALLSLEAPAVHFHLAVAEHDEALGWARRTEPELRTIEPFVDFLAGRIADVPGARPSTPAIATERGWRPIAEEAAHDLALSGMLLAFRPEHVDQMRLENLSDAELHDLVLEMILQAEAIELDDRILQGKLAILRAELVNRLRKRREEPASDGAGGAGVREPRRPIQPRGGVQADL